MAGLTVSTSTLAVAEPGVGNAVGSGTFTVRLARAPTGDVTVALSAASPDVSLSPASLTFTTGTWQTAQTVTVTASADANTTDDRVVVTLTPSGGGYTNVAPVTVTVTVEDRQARAPGRPTGFGATAGDRRVTLGARVSDGGAPIRLWRYRVKTGGGYGPWMALSNSALSTLTGQVVSGLRNGTRYTFEVRAVNRVGSGPVSGERAATPRVATPSPPGGGNPPGGGGGGGGAPTPPDPEPVGSLENPGPGSAQSGIGLLSGWVCEADRVELVLNPGTDEAQTLDAAYGTDRADTTSVCGDRNNGFGLLFNWNLLGDGTHTLVARADGEVFGRATVTVTTLGEEFVRGADGECTVTDFPETGDTTRLVWQAAQQNFVIAAGERPTGTAQSGTAGVGTLENPSVNSYQSGIGLISGWVCNADQVTVRLNAGPAITAAYGTERADTAAVCGDTNNGFGLLFNWNLLGDGEHEVEAVADGTVFGRTRVRVTTLGAEFVRGAAGRCTAAGFPSPDESVTLEWQQSRQNFVITDVQ